VTICWAAETPWCYPLFFTLTGVPYIQALQLEPAIRIERTTCGLRNSDNPTLDNLNPQETTDQADTEMGPDGFGLSSPGSNVAAD